jgi:hypothetical protein
MSDARLGMTELLSRDWFGFDMPFPGAGNFLGAGREPVEDDAAQPAAVILNLENQHEQTSRRLAWL